MALRRPLLLPTLTAGNPCPRDHGKIVSPDFGLALGRGPVYPVGLNAYGYMVLDDSEAEGGWFYIKVLWVGAPTVVGPVLIRGHQIDGPNEIRFERGSQPPAELKLTAPESHVGDRVSNWSDWPSYTRLRAPGCYAYQVDGPDFSQVIVFEF